MAAQIAGHTSVMDRLSFNDTTDSRSAKQVDGTETVLPSINVGIDQFLRHNPFVRLPFLTYRQISGNVKERTLQP